MQLILERFRFVSTSFFKPLNMYDIVNVHEQVFAYISETCRDILQTSNFIWSLGNFVLYCIYLRPSFGCFQSSETKHSWTQFQFPDRSITFADNVWAGGHTRVLWSWEPDIHISDFNHFDDKGDVSSIVSNRSTNKQSQCRKYHPMRATKLRCGRRGARNIIIYMLKYTYIHKKRLYQKRISFFSNHKR